MLSNAATLLGRIAHQPDSPSAPGEDRWASRVWILSLSFAAVTISHRRRPLSASLSGARDTDAAWFSLPAKDTDAAWLSLAHRLSV